MTIENLSALSDSYTTEEVNRIFAVLGAMTSNTVLTFPAFIEKTGLNIERSEAVLEKLCEMKLLNTTSIIRCPECGLCVCDNTDTVGDEIYCYKCDRVMQVTVDDTEEVYGLESAWW